MFHRDNPNVEVAAIVSWANTHISAQRIGVLGASNWSLDRIEAANQYVAANNLQGISLLSNHFGLAIQLAPRWPGARNVDPADRARLTGLGVPNRPGQPSAAASSRRLITNRPALIGNSLPRLRAPGQLRPPRPRTATGKGNGARPHPGLLRPTPQNKDFGSLGVFWAADRFELEQSLEAGDATLTPEQLDFLESG